MKTQSRRAAVLLSLFIILLLCHSTLLALEPANVAVIANSALPESVGLAQDYCQLRGIDAGHIIALDMPQSERIAWQTWQDKIKPNLRQRLEQPEAESIQCLVTVYGVPLRINRFVPQGNTLARRQQIDKMIQQSFAELNDLIDTFKAVNPAATIIKPKDGPSLKMPGYWIKRDQQARQMYQEADKAMWAARKVVKNMINPEAAARKAQEFEALFQRYVGLEGQLSTVAALIKQQPDRADLTNIKTHYEKGMGELKEKIAKISELTRQPYDAQRWDQRYELIRQAAGLKGLCRILIADRKAIGDEDSESAFDSELTLLLWPDYTPANQIPNILNPDQAAKTTLTHRTFMVSRLDGPTAAIARGLITRAIKAEMEPLTGQVYLDARNITKDTQTFGSYGYFDENIRQTRQLLEEKLTLPVHLDNRPALFGPHQCPATVLYCGWYSLRKYIDSFTFAPGAVGWHIASFEAETLHNADSNSQQWCKKLLEHGITATLGAVSEPYLHTFPLPDRFFDDLTSGRYTLAEAFFKNLPYNSWRIILIGDPLYQPTFPLKTPQVAPQSHP